MIVLFTDFGAAGPYVGQMKAAIWARAPALPVVDLLADAPAFDVKACAYLLAAHAPWFPPGTVFLGVVDPGVGTAARRPVVVEADGRWFVGPGNGLFDVVARRARAVRRWAITWRPEGLSASFHGRDLFAPVAARIALGGPVPGRREAGRTSVGARWPADLARVVYIDRFGNAMTGIRAEVAPPAGVLVAGGQALARAHVFGAVPAGRAFWYENAVGLVEIAVNRGRAAEVLDLRVGDRVTWRRRARTRAGAARG